MIQEFRDFIAKGNMIDIAVGFIMGAAFTAAIGSLVQNVLMPIVIGSFLTAIVSFLLVAGGGIPFHRQAVQRIPRHHALK